MIYNHIARVHGWSLWFVRVSVRWYVYKFVGYDNTTTYRFDTPFGCLALIREHKWTPSGN